MNHFAQAHPFPHVVIDGFMDEAVAHAAASELEAVALASWRREDHGNQVNKFWLQEPERMPPHAAAIVRGLDEPAFLTQLTQLTGIEDLQPDASHAGGGVHIHTTGGSLGIHADFNRHPVTGLHRRLNVLFYLNREWQSDWGGRLELWSARQCECVAPTQQPPAAKPTCPTCRGLGHVPAECAAAFEPKFNRAVIIATTDYGFHGVSKVTCPPDRLRMSVASYYYTATRPVGEASPNFHWSTWPTIQGRQ